MGFTLIRLQNLNPDKGCQLGAAQHMVVKLSEGLHQHHHDEVAFYPCTDAEISFCASAITQSCQVSFAMHLPAHGFSLKLSGTTSKPTMFCRFSFVKESSVVLPCKVESGM